MKQDELEERAAPSGRAAALRFWAHRLRHLLGLLVFVLLPLLSFGDIAEDVYTRDPFAWEVPLMRGLRDLGTPATTAFMRALSWIGSGRGMLYPLTILLILVAWRRSKRVAGFLVLALGGDMLLNLALKVVFHRDRPTVLARLWQESDYSFPSGHAMFAAGLAAAIVALLWRTRWRTSAIVLGALYAFLMGVSRVYLGVHYPTDVIAGWCLGVAWVSSVAMLSWPLLGRAQRDARRATQ